MKRLTLQLIRLYQKTISPDHGFFYYVKQTPTCRFYPTCSEYTYQSIEKNGLIKGLFQGATRILRCNPFNHGGYDPVHAHTPTNK